MIGWLERRLPVPQRPVLWIGWLRLGLLPVAAAIAILLDPSRIDRAGFAAVLGVAGAYAAAALLASRGPGDKPVGGWAAYVSADLLIMAALVYVSGGTASPLRSGLILIPVVVAILGSPRDTLLAVAGPLVAFVAIALLPRGTGHPPSDNLIIGAGLFIAWSCALVLALSLFLRLRSRRTVELSESRQRLMAQAVSAEERARRRLAVGLHDDPVQALLAARLFLARASDGDFAALGSAIDAVDQTLERLRETIFELYPPALEHSGLAVALEQLGARQAGFGAADVDVAVAPDACGSEDQLVFAIARELLTNAVKHAQARRIELSLRREQDRLKLEVSDDGVGMPAPAKRQAVEHGHIGLATTAERVDAAGGLLEIESSEGRGTRILAALPVATPTASGRLERPAGPTRSRAREQGDPNGLHDLPV